MKKLMKVLSMILIVFGVLATNTVCVNAEWRNNSKGWWYTEGDSYVKNCWKEINEKWYYFDYDGYIVCNTIVDGYYLNSDGAWSDGTEEIKEYQRVLSDLNLLQNKYEVFIPGHKIREEDKPYNIKFIDMDGNGIYEAVANFGVSNAGMRAVVFDYSNGKVNFVEQIAPYVYFCKDKQVIISGTTAHGVNSGTVYKYEGGRLIELHLFQYNWREGNPPPKCIIDDKVVSEERLKNFFEQYITDEEGKEFFANL